MSFLASMKSGWHHGKGGKQSKKGNYELALKHYLVALENARLTGNDGSVAAELECIALTYMRLNKGDEAKKYAKESYSIYDKFKDNNEIFTASVKRVQKILNDIDRFDSNNKEDK